MGTHVSQNCKCCICYASGIISWFSHKMAFESITASSYSTTSSSVLLLHFLRPANPAILEWKKTNVTQSTYELSSHNTDIIEVQRCRSSYIIEWWSSKRKAPSDLSLQQIGQWCYSWEDVYKYQLQFLALASQTSVSWVMTHCGAQIVFDDLQLGDWTFCPRNGYPAVDRQNMQCVRCINQSRAKNVSNRACEGIVSEAESGLNRPLKVRSRLTFRWFSDAIS